MNPIPPSLDRFGDELQRAAERELGPGTPPRRARIHRPRVLAGGTLGLAGVAAGVVIALGAAGSSAPPAFAITRHSDGSVLVHLANVEAVPAAERQLATMRSGEYFMLAIARGPATDTGPITCTSAPDAPDPDGPPVQIQLSTDGTSIVPAGDRGAGPWHLAFCNVNPGTFPGPGNTGAGNTGAGNTGSGS